MWYNFIPIMRRKDGWKDERTKGLTWVKLYAPNIQLRGHKQPNIFICLKNI